MGFGAYDLRKYLRAVSKDSFHTIGSESPVRANVRIETHSVETASCGSTTTVAIIGTSPAFYLYAL